VDEPSVLGFLLVQKVYVIVRSDLKPGQQAVQACHALSEFILQHPSTAKSWHSTSNTLALLSTPGEQELNSLAQKLTKHGFRTSLFREPDFGDALTAIAVEDSAKKLLCKVPLALCR
jgi:peptidyl-tRNA hydrolase